MGAPLSVPRRPISVPEYHKMIDAGVFHEDDCIELIEGELIQMAPIGGPHMPLVNLLNRILVQQVGEEGVVSPQNPVALLPTSEPEPDFVVLQPECSHRTVVPTAQDVLLVVEVSLSSLAYDRDVKIPLQPRHGIPKVWLFDVEAKRLSIYLEPGSRGYQKLLTPQNDETISSSQLPRVKIQLSTFR